MEHLKIEKKQEVLSYVTDVTYATVPFWYGATRKDLKLDIIIPKNRIGHTPLPCIVWVCGGAYMVNDKSVWMPEMLRFARAGYAVASVEYRGSNEWRFPEPLRDVKAAIRYLKAHDQEFCLDKEKFFIMGESAGGTMASLVGCTMGMEEYEIGDYLQENSDVIGVVDFYGVTDMSIPDAVKIVEENDEVPQWALKAFLGSEHYRENLIKASALNYVSKTSAPALILHGACDPLVALENSTRYYEALRNNGVYTKCYVVEDAVHGDDLFYQDEVIQLILDFLQQVQAM